VEAGVEVVIMAQEQTGKAGELEGQKLPLHGPFQPLSCPSIITTQHQHQQLLPFPLLPLRISTCTWTCTKPLNGYLGSLQSPPSLARASSFPHLIFFSKLTYLQPSYHAFTSSPSRLLTEQHHSHTAFPILLQACPAILPLRYPFERCQPPAVLSTPTHFEYA
jgi:hypothetical protein